MSVVQKNWMIGYSAKRKQRNGTTRDIGTQRKSIAVSEDDLTTKEAE
jgi:hypothetical protein